MIYDERFGLYSRCKMVKYSLPTVELLELYRGINDAMEALQYTCRDNFGRGHLSIFLKWPLIFKLGAIYIMADIAKLLKLY
jgi:hypothetical protein